MKEEKIVFLDRMTRRIEEEKVYGHRFLSYLYGKKSGFLSACVLSLIAGFSLASRCYGALQRTRLSKRKILPFIEKFQMDTSEFLKPVSAFSSFDEFFTRELKPGVRPLAPGADVAILPADARYLVYPRIDQSEGFLVKGQTFTLEALLQSKELTDLYREGSMVIARLCPTDYHRFHFPCSCQPSLPESLPGTLYSVNPLALRKKIEILAQNKRERTLLHTKHFGKILYMEVGATFVGSIHQTFFPNEPYAKGDEKGFFSFGGSTLILLFEKDTIQFDRDLLEASQERLEVRGLMGQSLGRSLKG